jgi:lysophospholipase L1-like esterase
MPEAVALGVKSLAERDLSRVHQQMKGSRSLTWVFTGDSITHGAKHLKGKRSYPELFASWLRTDIKRRGDIVINTAITGHSTGHVLTDFQWRVAQFNPDVVCINFGMNDSVRGEANRIKYESELHELVRRVRAIGAVPLISTTNTIQQNPPDAAKRADLPAYNDIIAKVARDDSVLLVDHWKHWQAAGPATQTWFNDDIHPNHTGHIEMFKTLLQSLQFGESPVSSAPASETAAGVTTGGSVASAAPLSIADDLSRIKAQLADKSTPRVWFFIAPEIAKETFGGARNTAEYFAERVRYEMVRLRDIVINISAPAGDSALLLTSFEERIARYQPAVVFIRPVGGDPTKAWLSEIVGRARAVGAVPIVQITPQNAHIARQIATEMNVLQAEVVAPVASDATPVSPSNAAANSEYQQALALFRLLDIYDAKSVICRLPPV